MTITLLNVLISFLFFLYPLAVYFGLQYFQPWSIALMLIICLLLRLAICQNNWLKPVLLAGLVYAGIVVFFNQALGLRFYPVLVNLLFLFIFAQSLFRRQSLIEQIARIQQPDLPEKGIKYTRKVTQVWCVFFMVNGSLALYTGLFSNFETWTLYNGLIAYLLMGLLFLTEYWFRQRSQNQG